MRVIDSFERLRHDAVIGCNNQHDDIGSFSSAGTHTCESFVTWRIQEHDLATVCRRLFVLHRDFVCADVLGDASSFTFSNAGRADGVE